MEITKEEWQEFKGHKGYKVLKQMLENTIGNLQVALGSGVSLGENVAQDTANCVGRVAAYKDILDFNPIAEEETDEFGSSGFPSYSQA